MSEIADVQRLIFRTTKIELCINSLVICLNLLDLKQNFQLRCC